MKNLPLYLAAPIASLCAVLLLVGCDTSELKPWHTQILDSEYSRENAAEINSFEDYLQLEDRVFAEMQQRIYAHTATGPQQALERYSRGSLSDPDQRRPNWNRTFEFGNDAARGSVLLLHGMSDSPYSLRALGETLQQHGYTVLGLRMPGHGTLPSGLLDLQWQDMAAVVRLGMLHLAQRAPDKPIYIIGYSTGAALALDYALNASQDTTQNPAAINEIGRAHV